ncbi:hypothetical protein [Myxococcus xanthus]|uniref:hypothetical protein n=1 Tax=Myxococcus xanthus TaxID=34 RepID=UPI001F523AE8|nr:hypothetical protein [Myxococcus xanthus]
MRLHALLPSSLLLVFLAPLGARAASGDEWLGPDKPKHFAACFVFAGAGYAGGALLFDNPHARWLTGAGLAMGAGVGKELYDLGRGTTFSMKDLAWDAVGTASGLAVSYVVDRLVFRRDDTPSEVARRVRLRRPLALRLHVAGDGGLPGGLATRMAFDELYQLLSMQPRVHRHQGAAAAGVAGDEHGDLAARALVHAAGGEYADLSPRPRSVSVPWSQRGRSSPPARVPPFIRHFRQTSTSTSSTGPPPLSSRIRPPSSRRCRSMRRAPGPEAQGPCWLKHARRPETGR